MLLSDSVTWRSALLTKKKKVCLLTSELSAAWYHPRQSFFSRRGSDCSWEDFVSKSQNCSVAVLSQFDDKLTGLCWLGPSQTTLNFDPWTVTVAASLSLFLCLPYSICLSFLHSFSFCSSCRLSQQHLWFSRPQRWTSGVCGNTEASSYCYTMTLL